MIRIGYFYSTIRLEIKSADGIDMFMVKYIDFEHFAIRFFKIFFCKNLDGKIFLLYLYNNRTLWLI